jgi:DNA-binding Lrp family transcriptional regulator
MSTTPAEPGSEKSVVQALEDKRYKWRTIGGIAGQTGISPGEVRRILKKLIDAEIVIRSTVPSVEGEDLYTTRRHYKVSVCPTASSE